MLEASRCSAMACHSSAGIVVTHLPLLPSAKLRLKEAERLLRGAESMARLATSLIQTLANGDVSAEPCSGGEAGVGGGDGRAAPKVPRRRRHKKRGTAADQVMGSVNDEPVEQLPPPQARVDVAVDSVAVAGVVSGGGGRPCRSLQERISRERSPRPASGAATDVLGTFGVGTTVVLHDLQARPELNGKTGKVSSFDPESGRYAVRIGRESLRVKATNLSASIFH